MNAKEVETMTEDAYDEMLDEAGPVTVCGMEFYPSRILEELDPIAYRCGFSDCQEYRWECEECSEQFDTEEEAQECCQPECDNCGETLKPEESTLCASCQEEGNEGK